MSSRYIWNARPFCNNATKAAGDGEKEEEEEEEEKEEGQHESVAIGTGGEQYPEA